MAYYFLTLKQAGPNVIVSGKVSQDVPPEGVENEDYVEALSSAELNQHNIGDRLNTNTREWLSGIPKRYAVLGVVNGESGVVINVVNAKGKISNTWVELTGADNRVKKWWRYIDDSFVEGNPPDDLYGYVITRQSFYLRFTDGERTAWFGSVDAASQAFLALVQASDHVNLQEQWVIDGVNNLETAGILTAQRASVIRDTPAAQDEV